jgi:hypothetical protein
MSIRIRVYPQGMNAGMYGAGGLGMNRFGGAVSAQTFYSTQLNSQKRLSSLQLGYERALWNERLDKVRLEERLKNPYAMGGYGAAGVGAYGGVPGYGSPFGGVPIGGVPIGGVPIGGMPYGGMPYGGLPMGGVPSAFGGSGQTNVTNQSANGAAHQSVSNTNTYNVMSTQSPWGQQGGFPFGGFGGGGLLSGLLGAFI